FQRGDPRRSVPHRSRRHAGRGRAFRRDGGSRTGVAGLGRRRRFGLAAASPPPTYTERLAESLMTQPSCPPRTPARAMTPRALLSLPRATLATPARVALIILGVGRRGELWFG